MSHLARATGALVVLALAVPAGTLAAAEKPKHTTTVKTVTTLPTTTPKNISRKCDKSTSSKRIRSRRTSHPTKNRIRTITTYCNGGTRNRVHDQAQRDHRDQDGHRPRARAGDAADTDADRHRDANAARHGDADSA